MKFIQIEDVILNTNHIVAITTHYESKLIPNDDDLPFGEYEKVVCGINVLTINCSEESHFVFKSETIESFLEKLKEISA